MDIGYEITGKKVIVKVNGSLSVQNAGEFEQSALFAMKDNSLPLVIDFSNLKYISSSGLSAVVALSRNVKEKKSKMTLLIPKGSILDVFKRTGLLSVFDITIL
ncbi:MAG TPA: hypothetical protein DD381_14020 [Lentisphaeria bacterium]|nr:MAG: hypothetical protein A2X47_01245 [Lentisphaerae bacterium GWF2_38_69]HBM17440.1 hypothetical protein [Lentisphaeria bacterium]